MAVVNHRQMSTVVRWQIISTIKSQSIAEHSYYVTVYALKISEILGWGDVFSNMVMKRALFHDLPEIVTGDIPTPYKKFLYETMAGAHIPGTPVTRTETHTAAADRTARTLCTGVVPHHDGYIDPILDSQINKVIKIADLLDAVLLLIGESRMGNLGVKKYMPELISQLNGAVTSIGSVTVQQWVDDAIASCFSGADLIPTDLISNEKN